MVTEDMDGGWRDGIRVEERNKGGGMGVGYWLLGCYD